jgi:hypothetical protein
VDARSIAVSGDFIAVSDERAILTLYHRDGTKRASTPLGRANALPLSLAASTSEVFYAAPEWTDTVRRAIGSTSFGASEFLANNVFDEEASVDIDLWRERIPRRHLTSSAFGLLDLVVLGGRAGLTVNAETGPLTVALPAFTYAGLATEGTKAFAIALDRGRYRSYLVTVELQGTPTLLSIESFTGAASGVSATGGRVYVSDADGSLRVYEPNQNTITLLGTLRMDPTP